MRELMPYVQVNNFAELCLLALIGIVGVKLARRIRSENEAARWRDLSIREPRGIMGEKRRSSRS